MFRETNQIIKQHGKACFVDVRAAFLLGEGKVGFHFRSLNQQNKVTGKIDCYISIEELNLIAHMFKTGSIFAYLRKNGRYVNYGGKRDSETGAIISRQLRIEGNEEGLYIKALQGPGKITATGGYAPNYKDNEALTILVKMDAYQAQMMGFAFQRAIDYYDAWNRSGILEEKMSAIRWKESDAEAPAHGKPAQSSAPAPVHHAAAGRPQMQTWQQPVQNALPQAAAYAGMQQFSPEAIY